MAPFKRRLWHRRASFQTSPYLTIGLFTSSDMMNMIWRFKQYKWESFTASFSSKSCRGIVVGWIACAHTRPHHGWYPNVMQGWSKLKCRGCDRAGCVRRTNIGWGKWGSKHSSLLFYLWSVRDIISRPLNWAIKWGATSLSQISMRKVWPWGSWVQGFPHLVSFQFVSWLSVGRKGLARFYFSFFFFLAHDQ